MLGLAAFGTLSAGGKGLDGHGQSLRHGRALQAAGTDVGYEIFRWVTIVVLVALSGTFSGLTLGLLGLDTNQLAIVAESGSPDKRRDAQRIMPIRKRGNLLLCTLLLGNVAVNSALSILMADVTSGLVGFFTSTIVIVIFGEILPQATCSRFPLYIGSRSIPLVRVFMLLLLPVTFPLAALLDWMLGKEVGDFYESNEFEVLIRKHAENSMIGNDPARIMQGALRMSGKKVSDLMTPKSEMFTLKSTARLDYDTMAEIFRQGYSRVPVVDAEDPERVTGMLYAKDLMLIVPANATPVATVVAFFHREAITFVNADEKVDVAFNIMLASKRHIAMVQTVDDCDGTRDPVFKLGGVITLEDIIETILQAELTDEYDGSIAGVAGMRNAELKRLTDVSKGFNDLDDSMVRAVTAHLTTNVRAFRMPHPTTGETLSLEAISELVQGSRVIEVVVPPGTKPEDIGWLYRRGELEDVCSIILEGEVEVFAGEDEIRVVRGTYDVMAERAVLSKDYVSDFSARPATATVRMLRITRNNVEEAFRISRGPAGVVSGSAGVEVVAGGPRAAPKGPAVSAAASARAPAAPKAEPISPGARAGSADDLLAPGAAAAGLRGRSSSVPRPTDTSAAEATAAPLGVRAATALAPGERTTVESRPGMKHAGLVSRYAIPPRKRGSVTASDAGAGDAVPHTVSAAPQAAAASKPPASRAEGGRLASDSSVQTDATNPLTDEAAGAPATAAAAAEEHDVTVSLANSAAH
ncbi:Cnnm2 [Symbiodinium sp. KB8]|nr:Cnnm2 [Symbiodinium sp. KB8]